MKETISGTCTTTHWQEQTYSKIEGGPKLTVIEKESAFEGGIQGKSVLRYSIARMRENSLFTGYIRITGRIGHRVGSFVVEDSGRSSPKGSKGTWRILPDSASGDFVGIRGEGGWAWQRGDKHETYTLSYEL